MTTEPEMKPRITELHVRMDCHGCEHKIKKTLSAIDGVSEVYTDQANQKITVVGIADPARIVKAIRKTKRVPTICSHTDPAAAEAQPPPPPPPAEGEAPPPTDQPTDTPPAEAAASPAPEPTPPENKEEPQAESPPAATDAGATLIRTVHENPYGLDDHLYREHWAKQPIDMYAAPVQEGRYYSHEHYYYPAAARGKGDGSQITSIFSDENPNACNIS